MKHEYQSEPLEAAPAPSRDRSGESIADLVRNLARDLSALFGKEVALAKAEVRESVAEVQTAVGAIATGAAIATAGLVVLLMSAVYGLGNVVDPWLAALIAGGAALLVGYLMVRSAKATMRESSIVPERTLDSARQGKDMFKRAIQ